MNYQSKMASLGYTEDSVSNGLKASIQAIKNAQKTLSNKQAQGASESVISEIESDIEDMDAQLVKAIESYHAKKPAFEENAKKMKAAREAKKAAKGGEIVSTETSSQSEKTKPKDKEVDKKTEPIITPEGATDSDKKTSHGVSTFLGVLLLGGLAFLGIKAATR